MISLIKRITQIWVAIVIGGFILSEAKAQTNSSPYSNFGLGDIQNTGFGRSKGMGGTGIGLRLPNMINVMNPASYSVVGTQSFIFDAGLEYQQVQYETEDLAQVGNGANITHMAIAFPFIANRWYTSVGLAPYSTVGYSIRTSNYTRGVGDEENLYEGSGGVNRIYWGHSVKLFKGLSVGVNAYYMFGTIDNVRTSTIEDEKNSSTVRWEKNDVVRDFSFDYGVQYQHSFSEDLIMTLGAVVSQPMDINVTRKQLATNMWYVSGRPVLNLETGGQLVDTLVSVGGKETELKMPLQYGVGGSVVLFQKIVLSGDYHFAKWSDTASESVNGDITDSKEISFGAEYVPNYRSLKYWDRVRFRLGARMEDTYWKFGNEQIKDMSISLGVGLPMKRGGSMFDFAFQVGQRGTIDNGLLKETYFKGSVNFTLQDFWFIKRKFD